MKKTKGLDNDVTCWGVMGTLNPCYGGATAAAALDDVIVILSRTRIHV